jgi:putative FmdB family regulatory protein
MPIFEYECKQCGHQFEFLSLPNRPAVPQCTSCKSKNLKQLISLCAVRSESTKKASWTTARKKAMRGFKDKLDEKHRHLHEHFEDQKSTPVRPHKDVDD